jgi:hypothetical protein
MTCYNDLLLRHGMNSGFHNAVTPAKAGVHEVDSQQIPTLE